MNTLYTKRLLKYFQNPVNMGEIKNADGVATVGNPVCGDVMRMYLKIAKRPPSLKATAGKQNLKLEEYIKDIKFQTLGCAAAIATSSVATQMVKGKNLKEALKLANKQIIAKLGGVPANKIHCSVLATQAIKKAIENYYTGCKAIPTLRRESRRSSKARAAQPRSEGNHQLKLMVSSQKEAK